MADLLEPFLPVQYLWRTSLSMYAYTMKHTVGVAVWKGLAVGQMEPRNLFNENFVDSYPRNLCSAKLRCYTVWEYNVADGVFLWPSSSIVQVSWNRKTANNKIVWLTNCENEASIIRQYTLTCMEYIHHSHAAFDTLGTVHIVFAFDALHPNSAVALDSVLVSFPPDSVVASFHPDSVLASHPGSSSFDLFSPLHWAELLS